LRSRLQVAAQRGLTKFCGRSGELEQMKRALELAKSGHGQIVAAMGEPGVGKSRLFLEFKAVTSGGCLMLEAYRLGRPRHPAQGVSKAGAATLMGSAMRKCREKLRRRDGLKVGALRPEWHAPINV